MDPTSNNIPINNFWESADFPELPPEETGKSRLVNGHAYELSSFGGNQPAIRNISHRALKHNTQPSASEKMEHKVSLGKKLSEKFQALCKKILKGLVGLFSKEEPEQVTIKIEANPVKSKSPSPLEEVVIKIETKKDYQKEVNDLIDFEKNFRNVLANYGYATSEQKVKADGNCLFRAVSFAAEKGTEAENLQKLRHECCNHLSENPGLLEDKVAGYLQEVKHYYESWLFREGGGLDKIGSNKPSCIEEGKKRVKKRLADVLNKNLKEVNDVDLYLEYMRQGTSHGGDAEIKALAHQLKRPIIVAYGPEYLLREVVGEEYKNQGSPIVLAYNGVNHYDVFVKEEQFLEEKIE